MEIKQLFAVWYMGRHRAWFKISRKLPHPNMELRREINIYLFGHRFAITWGW